MSSPHTLQIPNESTLSSNSRHSCAWKHLFNLRAYFANYKHSTDNINQNQLSTLIHIPEDRIVRYPLKYWINMLLAFLPKHTHDGIVGNKSGAVEAFASLINQSSFIVALSGDIQGAYTICSNAIQYYYTTYKINNNSELLCQAIQPWINMARLDRLTKKITESNEKAVFLSGRSPANNDIEHIVKIALEHAKILQNIPDHVAKQCHSVEQIINDLHIKNFTRLNKRLDGYSSRSFITNPVLREAKIVSEYYNNKMQHYQISVLAGFNLCRVQDIDVFTLRLAEYFHIVNDKSSLDVIVSQLHHYCTDLLQHENHLIEQSHLTLNIASSIHAFGFNDHAYSLCEVLLDKFKYLNDEPNTIATLKVLCDIENNNETSEYVERLSSLLDSTDYIFLKKDKTPSSDIQEQCAFLTEEINKILLSH